ncbi:MAG: hypothetical protein Q7T73_21105 [Beijerinckiaceae bacterium]|nr:hypothetical protein [Beijerinckiaceae bacterium]
MSISHKTKIALAAFAMIFAGFLSFSAPASAAYRSHHGSYHSGHYRVAPVRAMHHRPIYRHRPVYHRGYVHRPRYYARPIYRPIYPVYGHRCVVRKVVRHTPWGREVVRRRICR